MKYIVQLLFLVLFLGSCKADGTLERTISSVNWSKKAIVVSQPDSLIHGQSYLSVYSEIYSQTEHRTHSLTATVSMRNTGRDTLFITSAKYFDTRGKLIRSYFDHAIFIRPMETVEIVIDEDDPHGGTGANFVFNWMTKPNTPTPLFEGVMISTSGQQGLSFVTRGVQTK